jgi:hypothetical protein
MTIARKEQMMDDAKAKYTHQIMPIDELILLRWTPCIYGSRLSAYQGRTDIPSTIFISLAMTSLLRN